MLRLYIMRWMIYAHAYGFPKHEFLENSDIATSRFVRSDSVGKIPLMLDDMF
jgi:hypothetical protein